MKFISGNFWDHIDEFELILATTNGIINSKGCLVMGAGIALDFKNKYPYMPKLLAQHICLSGNIPTIININYNKPYWIGSFPTKYHWKQNSDLKLIENSAQQLIKLVDEINIGSILMTMPGTGMGKLTSVQVIPVLKCLDDRFTIITKL